MKFLALLKKELRESLVPMVLAMMLFVLVAGLMVRDFAHKGGNDYQDYERRNRSGYQNELFHSYPLREIISILIPTSVGLGIALGILHFRVPKITQTWPFLLHRSVSKEAILLSKLLCSLIVLGLALGVPWSWTYLHVNHIKTTGFPTQPQVLWEGWLYILLLGSTCYIGTALSVLSTARWYTTRFFGLAFVPLLLTVIIHQPKIATAFALMVLGIAILLAQLFTAFSLKEC